MSELNQTDENIEPSNKTGGTKLFKTPSAEVNGKIADTIGTGDNAKNSLVYLTIKWAFISATCISGLVVLNHWAFRENDKVPDFTEDIQSIWKIIIPIITLALGYAFGKHENKTNGK